MTGRRTPIEQLAGEVVSSDVAAQESLPPFTKTSISTGLPIASGLRGPALTDRSGVSLPLLAGLGAVGLIAVFGAYVLFAGGQPAPTPTLAAGRVTASPQATATPTIAPTATQPSETPTPTSTPTIAPTATPSVAPTVTPSATPLAFDPIAGEAQVAAISNETVTLPAPVSSSVDSSGDTYRPHDGSPATAEQPWIDLIGASGSVVDVRPGPATALSSHPCGALTQSDGVAWFTACNQSGPLPAGEYRVFTTYWQQSLPDPFPQTAQCVYIIQSDVDGDRSTGFQSNLPFNHLIGADVYFENLFFWDQAGTFQNYILATDHSLAPRPDTNELHGNLATMARWYADDLSSGEPFVQTAFIPADQLGDRWSVGGFCNSDRAASSADTFSVDAFGHPGDDDFPPYLELANDLPG